MESVEFRGRKVGHIPGILTRIEDFISKFESRNDDIWICAYMKCGSHWVNDILHKLCHPEGGGGSQEQMKEKLFVEITHHSHWVDHPSPRILNTHLPHPLLPQSVKNSKIIWCVRNTKDVAVSSFHHVKSVTPGGFITDLTWENYIANFLQFEPEYFPYHNEWFDLLKTQPANILQVNYEDMKLDTVNTVKGIVRFLNLDKISDEEIEKVVSNTSIDKMKKEHANDVLTITDNSDQKLLIHPGNLYRKGIIGDWRNCFTDEQNTAFNKLYHDNLKGRSYGFEKYMDL